MEIRLIFNNGECIENQLRRIWWKTYWAALNGYLSYGQSDKHVIHWAKAKADDTIEMISPGTKMVL